eukprot:TRINITY_DN93493_c0_g1_i1.p1 TRINITY_DN93493_c0_g1~~TRINITY_DN93493_c0_g1_i1.p1  ORF type:complete len:171 (+),score=23.19 TRINITY_DN93493_c0_g1_i1:219-731(+)
MKTAILCILICIGLEAYGLRKRPNSLSQDTTEECWRIFNLFDDDNNGSISIKELADAMYEMGVNPTKAQLQKMINEIDNDGSGEIDFNEFLNLFKKTMNELGQEEDLTDEFRAFDKDGNGVISASELRHVMTQNGGRLTGEEADEMVQAADTDGDGYINYNEFVRVMAAK